MIHRFTTEVFYEDTDMGGIVYHANYLKFIERARSAMVRALGIDQLRLKQEEGVAFVVRRLDAEFLAPARFEDVLEVETRVTSVSGARLELNQQVSVAGRVVFSAGVLLVCMSDAGRPLRLPAGLRAALAAAGGD